LSVEFQIPDGNITRLYTSKDCLISWYDHQKKALVLKVWNTDLGIHRQKAFELHSEFASKNEINTLVICSKDAIGYHKPDHLAWIRDTALPAYKKMGIKLIVYTFPKNHIARAAANDWLNLAKKFNFDFVELSTLDEAYSYVNKINGL
jgi:hypothetical protein